MTRASKPSDVIPVRADLLRNWGRDMMTGERSDSTHELLCIALDATHGPFDIDEAKAIAAMRMLLEACGWEMDRRDRKVAETWSHPAGGWIIIPAVVGLADFRTRTRETLRRLALTVGLDRR